jgi:hypothetical protein
MCCAHLFGWTLRLGMLSNAPCEVEFTLVFMVLDHTYSIATLMFPEKCMETSHPSTTRIICLWLFIIKANVLLLLPVLTDAAARAAAAIRVASDHRRHGSKLLQVGIGASAVTGTTGNAKT